MAVACKRGVVIMLLGVVLAGGGRQAEAGAIADKVVTIVADKLGVDASEAVPEARFIEDLGADDLDRVELIMEFEKEFNISIPDESAEQILTVGQAITYLEKSRR